jgi:hypothetical protein
MSMRNRVMLVTLGLALAGLVVTVAAQQDDEKVLIVRDGSVDVNVNNSHLKARDAERRHKWSKKGDTVQVFDNASAAEACTTSVVGPMDFNQVDLKILNVDTGQTFTIVADNDGFLAKLTFLMPEEWQFEYRRFRHRLVYGNVRPVPNLKIQEVTVTRSGGAPPPYVAGTGRFLCVIFKDN